MGCRGCVLSSMLLHGLAIDDIGRVTKRQGIHNNSGTVELFYSVRKRTNRRLAGSRQMRNQGSFPHPGSRHAWVDDDVDIHQSDPDIRSFKEVWTVSFHSADPMRK